MFVFLILVDSPPFGQSQNHCILLLGSQTIVINVRFLLVLDLSRRFWRWSDWEIELILSPIRKLVMLKHLAQNLNILRILLNSLFVLVLLFQKFIIFVQLICTLFVLFFYLLATTFDLHIQFVKSVGKLICTKSLMVLSKSAPLFYCVRIPLRLHNLKHRI